jgi:hypothetical protein
MALLPGLDRAFVDTRKLSEYLLNPDHAQGGAGKANFLERFGFSRYAPEELRDALLSHAGRHDVSGRRQTVFGQIFEVVGRISVPDGRNPNVLVVWMVRAGEDFPRLVTVVPS